ncbi:hypothetical protein V8F20_003257 [Naviculisporaceae sp. PSN 640]
MTSTYDELSSAGNQLIAGSLGGLFCPEFNVPSCLCGLHGVVGCVVGGWAALQVWMMLKMQVAGRVGSDSHAKTFDKPPRVCLAIVPTITATSILVISIMMGHQDLINRISNGNI